MNSEGNDFGSGCCGSIFGKYFFGGTSPWKADFRAQSADCISCFFRNFLVQDTTRGFSFHKVFVVKRLGVETAPKIAGNKWEYVGKAGNRWEIVALRNADFRMQIAE